MSQHVSGEAICNGVLESIGEFVGYVKQSKSKIERIRKLYAIMSTVTDLDGIGF